MLEVARRFACWKEIALRFATSLFRGRVVTLRLYRLKIMTISPGQALILVPFARVAIRSYPTITIPWAAIVLLPLVRIPPLGEIIARRFTLASLIPVPTT